MERNAKLVKEILSINNILKKLLQIDILVNVLLNQEEKLLFEKIPPLKNSIVIKKLFIKPDSEAAKSVIKGYLMGIRENQITERLIKQYI